MSRLLEAFMHRQQHILGSACDPLRRRLYLYGVIDEGANYRFQVGLDLLNEKKGPITVRLSSPGGETGAGGAIFDAIAQSRNPVTIVGTGQVMSMAAIIMQAAHLRLLTPETRFMVHAGAISFDDSIDTMKLKSMSAEMHDALERDADLLSRRTNIKKPKILDMITKETYMSAQQALDMGFVDGIFQKEE
jgi:ATP-dependent Clp protease protease subunit